METREYALELPGQATSSNDRSDARSAKGFTLTLRGLRCYQTADALSGCLICFMVVFSPWAFGTTQRWSIWTMNICGYVLGLLLLLKLYVRFRHGYQPPRWGEQSADAGANGIKPGGGKSLVIAVAIVTVLILAYCLVSALNARATYQPAQGTLTYHEHIPWLPHTYDSNRTWHAFWNYLALAFSFWAARDWLLGCSTSEARARRQADDTPGRTALLPQRLLWLLWLVSINGALLAVEGICQRVSGTNKLLWVMPTRLNRVAHAQFGPYAYRASGAQYLNLVWPATLGLWWALHREARRRLGSRFSNAVRSPQEDRRREGFLENPAGRRLGDPAGRSHRATVRRPTRFSAWKHNLLLPCVLVMAAGPIISSSRGGAIVAVAMTFAAGLILMLAMRRSHPLVRFVLVLCFCAVFALGAYVGGGQLMERMGEFGTSLAGREASYETGRRMARDYLLFGVGPGAFDPMFQFYRTSITEYWPAQMHNDWLETRITFGWLGSFFIGLAFLLVLLRGLVPGGVSGRWPFVVLLWLALAGCLVHARWDFPFQIYSIVFLFLILCGILSTLSLRDWCTALPGSDAGS